MQINKCLFLMIFILFLSGCGNDVSIITTSESEEQTETSEVFESTVAEAAAEEESVAQSVKLAVYVCGAVCSPGVYYLEPGAIVLDALLAAGDFAEGASTDYINLAQSVISGERIYFPYQEEIDSGIVTNDMTASHEASDKININTATASELVSIPGIGESRANDIIKYRETNGEFTVIEDIMKVSGIKEGLFEGIRDYIIVN